MENKSKKNAIIDAFADITQKRDNTYTSPMVMAPHGGISYSSKNKKPVIVNGKLVIPKQELPESASKSNSAIIRDSEKAAPKDNTKAQVRDTVKSVKTPESLVRKTIKDKIDREYRLKYPTVGDRVSDIGTHTVSAMKTLGGSVIGNAINDVSPRAANVVSKYTGGLITPTSQEDIEVGRLGTPLQKAGMVADGVTSVLEAQMFGKLMNVAGNRVSGKLAGEKIQSRASTAIFDTQKKYTKNGVSLSKEWNEQTIPGEFNPRTAKTNRYPSRAESVVEPSKLAKSTDRPVSYNWDLISTDVSKMKDGTLTRIESMSRDTRRFLTSHGGMELLETRADGSFGSTSAIKKATSKIASNKGKRMSIAGKVDDVASEKITQIELARDARIAKNEAKSFLNDDIVRETADKNSELAKRISSSNKKMADELKYPFIVDAEAGTFRRANSINDLRDAYMYNKASVKFDNLPSGVSANIKKQAGVNEISLNYSDNVATVAGTEERVRALTHEYLHNARYGDTAIEQLKASKLLKPREELLKLASKSKNSNLLVKDFGEGFHYLESAGETSTNIRDIAKILNVNTGDKYPGWKAVKNIMDNYKGDEKRFVFDALKLDKKRDYKRIWDAMTGKYLAVPAAISTTAIPGVLSKDKQDK